MENNNNIMEKKYDLTEEEKNTLTNFVSDNYNNLYNSINDCYDIALTSSSINSFSDQFKFLVHAITFSDLNHSEDSLRYLEDLYKNIIKMNNLNNILGICDLKLVADGFGNNIPKNESSKIKFSNISGSNYNEKARMYYNLEFYVNKNNIKKEDELNNLLIENEDKSKQMILKK